MMLKRSFVLIAALIVVACDAPPPRQYPPINFKSKTPIYLDVRNIDVVNEYDSPMRAPHVEHVFPVSPQKAINGWIGDRLKSAGMQQSMRITIREASAVEIPLKTTGGVGGWFTNEQASKITAHISVELRIYGESSVSIADTRVQATRSITLAEDTSPVERDDAYYKLTKLIMMDLDAELEKNIHQYFSKHIHYSYTQ